MAIDNCPHSFETLAEKVLPAYFEDLENKMAAPNNMAMFGEKGVGKKTILKYLKRESDFPGCYVLIDGEKPIYIGISRSIVQRLLQHVKGTTHFDASLAYRIASKNTPHTNQRDVAMSDPDFKKEFEAELQKIIDKHNANQRDQIKNQSRHTFAIYAIWFLVWFLAILTILITQFGGK